MKPYPHQIEGAQWLAARQFGILADEPRVGKTGTAIMACDLIGAKRVLVVTTASGRGVWRRGFADWSPDRETFIALANQKKPDLPDTVIVGWPSVSDAALRRNLLKQPWDVLILDEGHYAKSFAAKRTQAVFGEIDGPELDQFMSLASGARRIWSLTGTPMPNSPFDLYPVLRACAPMSLMSAPVVTLEDDFKRRYCRMKPKRIGHGYYARTIDVIVGGQNLDELRQRCEGLILRRTQQDVGIREPIYETLPLVISDTQRKRIDAAGQTADILKAIDSGETKDLEMHLGPLRRLTGALKADLVAQFVKDEFENGLDRVVLAYWHKDVGDALHEALADYGVSRVDGSSSALEREVNVGWFQTGTTKVFLGQIAAAGEAIDLSASAELIFVEPSFIPKDMKQMALRITNHTQKRQPRVRVATLDGSIDDAVQTSLLRKWSAINEVLK